MGPLPKTGPVGLTKRAIFLVTPGAAGEAAAGRTSKGWSPCLPLDNEVQGAVYMHGDFDLSKGTHATFSLSHSAPQEKSAQAQFGGAHGF